VESPRGRLHHLVRLDTAGRVAFYAILAPTEWNFGADGPLVATLRANRPTADDAGRARVERIAAAFDPCVGFAVTVKERDHA
jgi:coenzyme F420-reducing hydrogenase alpha subunit